MSIAGEHRSIGQGTIGATRRWRLDERVLVLATQVGIVAAVLLAWEYAPDNILDDTLVSRPSLIAAQTLDWLATGVLQEEALSTLTVVVLGLLWGALAGISLGLAVGLLRPVARTVEPLVNVFFAIPKVALVPLFIVWFGVGIEQHVIYTATVVFFFFFFSAFNGTRSVPQALGNMLVLAGASPLQRVRMLYLPASFGWILSGLKLAMPYAFVSAISAEVIASRTGLGNLVKSSASNMDPAGSFSALIFLLVLSVVCSSAVLAIGERSRWRINP